MMAAAWPGRGRRAGDHQHGDRGDQRSSRTGPVRPSRGRSGRQGRARQGRSTAEIGRRVAAPGPWSLRLLDQMDNPRQGSVRPTAVARMVSAPPVSMTWPPTTASPAAFRCTGMLSPVSIASSTATLAHRAPRRRPGSSRRGARPAASPRGPAWSGTSTSVPAVPDTRRCASGRPDA